jgi:hypothetical protein
MNAILNDKINIAKAVNAEDKSERCTKRLLNLVSQKSL